MTGLYAVLGLVAFILIGKHETNWKCINGTKPITAKYVFLFEKKRMRKNEKKERKRKQMQKNFPI